MNTFGLYTVLCCSASSRWLRQGEDEAMHFWGRGTSLGLSTAVLLCSTANRGCSLNEALHLLMLHSPSALSDRQIRRH